MQLGEWQLDTIDGGSFRIDGGVMFGVVPKRLWEPVAPPDELNRIACANNCVLARSSQSTVLIDTGYGDKYSPLDRKFYSMDAGQTLLDGLAALGLSAEDIDTVVLSHLHFDHVGGATRYDDQRRIVPTFPRARHMIGRVEWEDAISGSPELESAYIPEHLWPLQEAGLVTLIDDHAEIMPGLRARVTGGHTRGHMALLFQSAGQTAVYPADICPSTGHIRRMWHLAYDLYPVQTRQQKPQLLGEAADQGWWILWGHDPNVAISRIQRDPKREFVVVEQRENI